MSILVRMLLKGSADVSVFKEGSVPSLFSDVKSTNIVGT